MGAVAIERIESEMARTLWAESPHATVFTRPNVLAAFFEDVHWWGAFKGLDLIAAWPVPLDERGLPTTSGWFYFVGPLWSSAVYPPPPHRTLSATLPVYTGFIESLIAAYGGFSASLPPTQADVRAFTWWRYAEGAPIQVAPQYTARIEGLSGRDWKDVLAGMRQVRRYALRQTAHLKDITWSDQVEAKELCNIYLEQTPGVDVEVLRDSQKLLAIAASGSGFVSVGRDTDGMAAAVVVALYDCGAANLVISSVANKWRASGLSVQNTARAIAHAQSLGLSLFDFNGANSPQRGDDKHSYGAREQLYFNVSYRASSAYD